MEETYESSSKNHSEEGEGDHDELLWADRVHVQERDHRVVEHNRHTVVKQWFTEHKKIQTNIHVDLLESE